MMTKKAYITRGISDWTVCFWNGSEARFLHGFCAFDVALVAVKMFWRLPPDSQNGFRTVVELT